jgi:hypothetical protein
VDLNLDIHVNPVGHCTSVDSQKSSGDGKTTSGNKTKVSMRTRKAPVTRSNDFLWESI